MSTNPQEQDETTEILDMVETQDPTVGNVIRSDHEILECSPDTPLFEAAARMRAAKCSSIIVMDADHKAVGIWTEHDALRLDFGHPETFSMAIRDVMSTPVRTVEPDAHLTDVAHRFRDEHIRHLLVVDDNGESLGIVTQTDVVLNQGIEHYLHFRKVENILTHDTVRVAEDTRLSDVSICMRQARIDAVLVMLDDGGWGILTERDLIRLIADRHEDTAVGEVATRQLFTVAADLSLFHVRKLMNERHVRHIGVERKGEVLGLVSFSDLLSGIELAYVDELRNALQERDKALAISRRSLLLAEKIIETSLEGVLITDAKGIIRQVNPAFSHLTGYAPEEVIGHPPSILSSGRHDKDFYDRMWASLSEHGHWRGEIWNRRKNGKIYPELLNITAIHDEEGNVSHYAALFSDISELKESEQRIRHLAYYDPLTNLPNRRLFYDRLAMAIAHSHRGGTRLAVMFIDLDRFKNINDTLGHNVGDQLLEQVAQRLGTCLREDDSVSRTGGDEFLILLSDVQHYEDAAVIAQRIISTLTQPFAIAGNELVVTCSIGISFYPEDGEDQDSLVKHADVAMYRAKEQGRNTYRLFTNSMNEQARRRLEIETGLRQALDNDEFEVHFQPIIDARSGKLVTTEALARWHHPEWGMVPPDEFIPLAEETGLIIPIGKKILDRVARQIVAWDCRIPVSLNLSARQFADTRLVRYVSRILDRLSIPGNLLTLEITESVLMTDVETHIAQMQAFRDKGLRISIDDFGTGYSSLAYLRRFPLDCLKIDRSFVSELLDNDDARAIVSATINMAHSLRLKVVAEGVETAEQVEQLRALGCDFMQGYHFSRPLPPKAFAEQVLPQFGP